MGRYSIVAAGLLLFSCGLAIAEGLDYADKLAVLSDVRLRDQAQTAKRYRYVLPRMAERCADLPNGERAADLMVKAHQLIDEAGVTEPIPRLVERLYLLFAEVAPAAAGADTTEMQRGGGILRYRTARRCATGRSAGRGGSAGKRHLFRGHSGLKRGVT